MLLAPTVARALHRRVGAALVGACLLCVAAPAAAMRPVVGVPEGEISVGPSLAYWHDPEDHPGASTGIDFAAQYSLLWGTIGTRFLFADDRYAVVPYAEAGVGFILNVGGGYSHAFGDAAAAGANLHLFVGLMIPPELLVWDGQIYFEPYYRPMWGLQDANAGDSHEVGLLVKWTTCELH